MEEGAAESSCDVCLNDYGCEWPCPMEFHREFGRSTPYPGVVVIPCSTLTAKIVFRRHEPELFSEVVLDKKSKNEWKFGICRIADLVPLKYEWVTLNGEPVDMSAMLDNYNITRWHQVFVPEDWEKDITLAKILEFRKKHVKNIGGDLQQSL